MAADWLDRPEGGSALALSAVKTVALVLGRTVSRVVLLPVTAYFLLRRAPERRASLAYLRRVLGRPPTWLDVARHIHRFSQVTLDRVYFLTNSLWRFDIRLEGIDELHRAMDLGRGVLLIGAHVGSFDALRAVSTLRPDVTVKVVLDAAHSPTLSSILRRLNPGMAAAIIDPRQDGTLVALEIAGALREGALVTMLGDRRRPGNATTTVSFLGTPAAFPTAPWQIAAAVHVPVVLCLGLYRGGARYDLHFELLSEGLVIERRHRDEQLQRVVQNFANRLARIVEAAPYNWFNFFDFWESGPSASLDTESGSGPGRRLADGHRRRPETPSHGN